MDSVAPDAAQSRESEQEPGHEVGPAEGHNITVEPWLDDHAPTWRPSAARPPDVPVASAEDFRSAFRNHPAGVAVITADPGDRPVALTATSVFSVSAEPPMLVFSVSALSSATPSILRSETVVVHLLGAGQLEIAKLGATSGVDRFADTRLWSRLPSGEPHFHATDAWIRGRIVNRMDAGGSTIVVIHALEAHSAPSVDPAADVKPSPPLVYHNRTWHRLGAASQID